MEGKIYTNKEVNYQYDNKKIRSGHDNTGYLCTEIFLNPVPPGGDTLNIEIRDYLVTKEEGNPNPIEVKIYEDLNYGTRPLTDLNNMEDIKASIATELLYVQKLMPIRNTTADDWVSQEDFLMNIFPNIVV